MPVFLVAVDDHGAQPNIAGSRLEADRHAVQELAHYEFLLHANHSIIRAGHPNVGDVGRPLRQKRVRPQWARECAFLPRP